MLSSTPTPTLKFPLNEADQSLVTNLENLFKTLLTVELYVAISGELVLHTLGQKPIKGFIKIYHFATANQLEIPEDFAKRILHLEDRCKNTTIPQKLMINQIAQEYKNQQPDMSIVLDIMRKNSDDTLKDKNGDAVTGNFTHYYHYLDLADTGAEYLAAYIDALLHPKLGELFYYLSLFERIFRYDVRPVLKNLEAKDHDHLIVSLKTKLNEYLKAQQLIELVINKIRDIKRRDHTVAQVQEVIYLVKLIGKNYVKNIVIYEASWYSLADEITDPIESWERNKTTDLSMKSFMSLQQINEVYDAQPDDLPLPENLQIEGTEEAANKLSKHIAKQLLDFLDELLYRIEYKKSPFPEAEIQQIIKLVQVVDGVELQKYAAKADRNTWHYTDSMTPLDRAMNIGHAGLFRAIAVKIDNSIKTMKAFEHDAKLFFAIDRKKDWSEETRKEFFKTLFEVGTPLPFADIVGSPGYMPDEIPIYTPVLRQVYAECFAAKVAEQMEAMSAYLTPDPVNMVLSYCEPIKEVIQPARQLVGARARMFANIPHDEQQAATTRMFAKKNNS